MNLLRWILRRGASALPLLLVIPFVTLLLMQLIPGNYFDSLRINPQISPETVQQYEKMYHLDQPFFIQYGYWLRNLFQGDLGYSFAYRRPVAEILSGRLWNTFLL